MSISKENDVEKYEYHCEHCSWKSRDVVNGNNRLKLESNISEKLNNSVYISMFNNQKEYLIDKQKEYLIDKESIIIYNIKIR